MRNLLLWIVLGAGLGCISGCQPEVGSDAWCQDMVDKPKGDWTANEAGEFAKSCILKSYDEK